MKKLIIAILITSIHFQLTAKEVLLTDAFKQGILNECLVDGTPIFCKCYVEGVAPIIEDDSERQRMIDMYQMISISETDGNEIPWDEIQYFTTRYGKQFEQIELQNKLKNFHISYFVNILLIFI